MPTPEAREEFHNLRSDHNAQVMPGLSPTAHGVARKRIKSWFHFAILFGHPGDARKIFAMTTANSRIFATFIVLFHLIKSESTMATARHLRFCVSLISGRHVIIYSSVSSFTNSCRVHANFSHPFSAGLDRFSNLL